MSHVVTFSTKTPLAVSQKMLAWASYLAPVTLPTPLLKIITSFTSELEPTPTGSLTAGHLQTHPCRLLNISVDTPLARLYNSYIQ